MKTSLFDYHLPEGQIAQHSVEPRDFSRLMVLDRKTGAWQHKQFFQIGQELNAEDVLVFNDTKVFRARLRTSDHIEIFLLRAVDGQSWETLLRPGRKIKVGNRMLINHGLIGKVKEKRPDGIVVIEFDRFPEQVIEFANTHGEIPVPPYIKKQPDVLEKYQTVYAKQTGSVAAPTAGFHFTKRLMGELKEKGIPFEFVTLHVGIGTFRPMKSKTVEEHEMHSEWVSVSQQTAERINQAKKKGKRIVAVGTTAVRTLEGIVQHNSKLFPEPVKGLTGFTGGINVFIKPGFEFKVIDGLITNFHLPKSTLLVLVSAFAGREHLLTAYEEAIKEGYRFFSFGDAMFLR